jgi:hypothetical protein
LCPATILFPQASDARHKFGSTPSLTFIFDQIVDDDLPLFLQTITDQAFRCLRRVSIYWAYGADLTVGLDLLVGCKSLRSLEIYTGNEPLTKEQQRQHEPILKCFRLETFAVKSTSNPSGDAVVSSNGTSDSFELWKRMETECDEWWSGLRELIISNKERTTRQQRRVEKPRQAKVRVERPSFVID